MANLNAKQLRFVDEYLVDLNATQAAIRAGYSAKTAGQIGERMLKKVEIQAALTGRMKAREKRTEITQDMVLRRYWEIATADANELVQFRRTCCRHCWGIDHGYQWIDEDEYQRAVAAQEPKENGEMPPPPDTSGGFGFDSSRDPSAQCPKCHGDGHGHVHVQDTRKLAPAARALYAGVKQSKEGLEVKMHDQMAALTNVAKHLGMFKDKVELSGKDGAPIETRNEATVDEKAVREIVQRLREEF